MSKAGEFLKRQKMHPEQIDMESCCNIFLKEMAQGLAGRESSLEMIPTYIETQQDVPTDKLVVVIDAGGTNFRVAVVHFNRDRQPVIEDQQLHSMPGTDEEIGALAAYLVSLQENPEPLPGAQRAGVQLPAESS